MFYKNFSHLEIPDSSDLHKMVRFSPSLDKLESKSSIVNEICVVPSQLILLRKVDFLSLSLVIKSFSVSL